MPTPPDRRLARLLEAPHLARVVPTLTPETLYHVIDQHGLDACRDLVVLATPTQLTSVLDLDLWRRSAPDGDEAFDVVRFGEWLEVLADGDQTSAAHVVAGLDRATVVAGLSRFIRVFDPIATSPYTTLDGERVDPAPPPATPFSADLGGYQIRAIRTEAWDAIVAVLAALESEQPACFRDVLQDCRRLSSRGWEADEAEGPPRPRGQRLDDVAGDRRARRDAQGYVDAAEARAFLQAARVRAAASGPRARLTGTATSDDQPTRVRALLASLAERDPAAFDDRMRELAFLANVLAAGCSFKARAFTPQEAAAAAAATCNLGLECLATMQTDGDAPPRVDLRVAFEAGWALLHRDVALFTADRLSGILAGVRSGDTRTHVGLRQLRHELARQRAAGTPWKVHDALDVIAILDVPAWTGLLGLLDECPTLAAVVEATLDGHRGAVSAVDSTFIATVRQVRRAQAFLARVPAMLAP